MKILVILLPLVLAGCNWGNSAHRDDQQPTPGEAAGHAAYVVEKDAKKAANEVSKDVKSFRHDAKEAYQEAKQKDEERKDADK